MNLIVREIEYYKKQISLVQTYEDAVTLLASIKSVRKKETIKVYTYVCLYGLLFFVPKREKFKWESWLLTMRSLIYIKIN